MIYVNNILYNCLVGKKEADSSQDELYRSILNKTCTEVEIPNNVTSIRSMAFANCSSLTQVIIPSSVESISGDAFYNCGAITDIYIDKDENSIGGANWGAYNATIHWNSKGPISIPVEPEVEGGVVVPATFILQFINGDNINWEQIGGLPTITIEATDGSAPLSEITYPDPSDLIDGSEVVAVFKTGTTINWAINGGEESKTFLRTSGEITLNPKANYEPVEVIFTPIEF